MEAPLRLLRRLEAAMTAGLRLMRLFIVMLALTGCPGPTYAPYNNMTNSYG